MEKLRTFRPHMKVVILLLVAAALFIPAATSVAGGVRNESIRESAPEKDHVPGEAVSSGLSAIDRMKTSAHEIKVSMSERLNAFLSFGAPAITDLTGRRVGENYRALVGFHVAL